MYISGFEEVLDCPLKSSLLIGGVTTILGYLLKFNSPFYWGILTGGLSLAIKARSGG